MLKNLLLKGVILLERAARHAPALGSFRPARGYFSAYDRLQNDQIQGSVILDRQATGPCPPGSITERASMRQHDHQPWPVFWTVSEDARLVGSILQWRDAGDRICSEGAFHFHERRELREDSLTSQIFVPKPRILDGAWTSIASNWGLGGNYYHWLTDSLTRLMVREHLPETTRILIPNKPSPFIDETLSLLGLENLAERAAHPCLRPERFYFCSPTAMTGVWNPAGFDWLRQRFLPYFAEPASGAPVFLTRRGTTRIPMELDFIESEFRSRGFEILDCAKLSVREQIRYCSGATAIAGIHGSAMSNILWACPGTPVLEIFQSMWLNGCYEQIAFQGGLGYSPIVLNHSVPTDTISSWIDHI